MIRRQTFKIIKERLRMYPAVSLLGPRQVGKTTLAKSLGGNYFDLEKTADRVRLDAQWESVIRDKQLVILDEAQEYPEVFSRLRSAIDEKRERNGRFLVLGSVSPKLIKRISQSLTGRISLVELTPLLASELRPAKQNDLWLYGGFPNGGVLDSNMYPFWEDDYVSTFTQQDLPNWGFPASPTVSRRLFKMLAAENAQQWNASKIGRSLGLSNLTIDSYVDWFEGSFLIRRLHSYHANISKRLRKRPKLFVRDSGLMHFLLQVNSFENLFDQPWVGYSWEGFVIEQILNSLEAKGRFFTPYYFRTSNGVEIDLVLDFGSELWAIEIKLTSNPSEGDFQQLNKAADMIGATRRVLVSRMKRSVESDTVLLCNLNRLLQELKI